MAKKIRVLALSLAMLIGIGLFQNCSAISKIILFSNNSQAEVTQNYFPVGVTRGLLITNYQTLNSVYDNYDLGYLIGGLAQYETNKVKLLDPNFNRTPGRYIREVFSNAAGSQKDYAAYVTRTESLGLKARNGPKVPDGSDGSYDFTMKAVFKNWRTRTAGNVLSSRALRESEFDNITQPVNLKSGKFRLLAISNRLDLAGETDDRITNGATELPRYLGEIHLIYGLVDSEYEMRTSKPFPMTFVLSYALPPISSVNGSYVADPIIAGQERMRPLHESIYGTALSDPLAPPPSMNLTEWKARISLWARLWAGLNRVEALNPQYLAQLNQILSLAVRPENFISMKSNTEFVVGGESHFEFREWYVFKSGVLPDNAARDNNGGQLIFRYIRREPYRCLANSTQLKTTLDYYWRGTDLDMTTRRDLDRGPDYDEYRGGYAILRDNKRPLNSQMVQIKDLGNSKFGLYWNAECGDSEVTMPYGMLTGPNRDESVTNENSADGTVQSDQLFMIVPFARLNPNIPVWKITRPDVDEPRRHSFAMRTCTGCHSSEGATYGFHIAPRMANVSSKLSPFLTGEEVKGGVNPFIFKNEAYPTSHPPFSYKYNELERRRRWAEKLADPSRGHILYNSLKVPNILESEE